MKCSHKITQGKGYNGMKYETECPVSRIDNMTDYDDGDSDTISV